MKNINSFFIAIFIYIFIQGVALWISAGGYGIKKGIVEKVDEGEIQPVTENPRDPYSAVYLFVMIIIATVFLFMLLKYGMDLIIKILIFSGFMVGLYFTFSNIFGCVGGFLLAISLLLIFIWKRDNIFIINLVLLFVIPGIGSLIGASLSLIPALIFIVALSFYDIIAVFGTKHMIKIAEESRGKIPLMFAIPVGDRYLGLGTGDMALPVVFTVSMLRDYSIEYSIISAIGGLIGLIILLNYILNKKGLALPALPPITVGLLSGFIIALLSF